MNTTIQANEEDSGDRLNYKSKDGLVSIITKVATARRWPQHDYPVVCIQLRPQCGTRVQKLDDGSEGIDVLMTHQEVAQHIQALNEADPKAGYKVPHVPGKPMHRKEHWDEINRKRRRNRGRE